MTAERWSVKSSLRSATSDWTVISALVLAIAGNVLMGVIFGAWSLGCLSSQVAGILTSAVVADLWVSKRKEN